MNRRTLASLAVATAMTFPGILLADVTEDEASINAIWDTYEATVVEGNVDAWLALWDEAGIQMPPGGPARGKDAMTREAPEAWEAAPASAMEISPEEIVIMGDWAFSRGNYTVAVTSEGNVIDIDGKFMTIFRRQDDGSWRIYRDIFNSNA